MSDFFSDVRRAVRELITAGRGRPGEPASERAVAVALALAAVAFAAEPVRARFGAKAGEALLQVATVLWNNRNDRDQGYRRYPDY